MPKLTLKLAEEILRKEVIRLDKSVQLVSVSQTEKKDAFRATLLKGGKNGMAIINKDVIKAYIDGEGKGGQVRKALGKAVSHLSIQYKK